MKRAMQVLAVLPAVLVAFIFGSDLYSWANPHWNQIYVWIAAAYAIYAISKLEKEVAELKGKVAQLEWTEWERTKGDQAGRPTK